MASSLASGAQRLLESQPLLPLDLSYSTLYGIYTGANTFNCPLNYPSISALPIKMDPQDVENNIPTIGPFTTLDQALNVVTTSQNSFGLLDCSRVFSQAPQANPVTSSACDSDGSSSTVSTSNRKTGEKRKELIRDAAYYERRKKNNDAAKRSRDSRRRKEDEVAMRAVLLEQENERLKFEVSRLRAEIEQQHLLSLNSKLLINPFDWDQPVVNAP